MLFLNNGRLVPSKGASQALFEVIELGSKSFNYSPGHFRVFEGGRLLEDRQRFCTRSRLSPKPHQAFWLDAYVKQVFEELIKRVVGIAHDKNRLVGSVVENLSD